MHGRKRTTEKVRKDGIQERVGRVQENEKVYSPETQNFEAGDQEILEALYEIFKPFNWGS